MEIGDVVETFVISKALPLGEGGFATVYLAQPRLPGYPSLVAIKLAPAKAREALAQEAIMLATLQGMGIQHVPRIYPIAPVNVLTESRSDKSGLLNRYLGQVVIDLEPFYYLSLEYLPGSSLKDKLDKLTGRGMGVSETLRISEQIAEALQLTHEQGMVHLDVKPSNIMFNTKGDAALIDFGASSHKEGNKTTWAGTAPYAPLEQISQDYPDHRADIHALGVTVYEMLTRRLPYNGATPTALANALQNSKPMPISRYAPQLAYLDNIIARAIYSDPDGRYTSVGEFMEELIHAVHTRQNQQAKRRYGLIAGLAGIIGLTAFSSVLFDLIRPTYEVGKRPVEIITRVPSAQSNITLTPQFAIANDSATQSPTPYSVAKVSTPTPLIVIQILEEPTLALIPTNTPQPRPTPSPIPTDTLPLIPINTVTNIPKPTFIVKPAAIAITIKNAKDVKILGTMEEELVYGSDVEFSSDGHLLAACGAGDNAVHLWDPTTGMLVKYLLSEDQRDMGSCSFSPDGKFLAAGAGNDILLWQINDGKLLRVLLGHTDPINNIAFSPDGELLASGGWDSTVRLWKRSDGTLLSELKREGPIHAVAFSPNGLYLAVSDTLYEVKGGGTVLNYLNTRSVPPPGESSYLFELSFSPSSKRIASASNMTRLWNVSDGAFVESFEGSKNAAFETKAVVFSSDGRFLVTGSTDKTVKVWDIDSGKLLNTLKGHQDAVMKVAISPDGKLIGSISWDGEVKLWGIP